MLESGEGNDKAYESVILVPRNTKRAIELAFFHIGRNLTDELSRQMLAKDKTGRTYIRRTRSGRRRRHVASAPGQTAANRTGNMRKSRTFEVRGHQQLYFGIDGAPYAKYLEQGTQRIQKRPSLDNTVRAERKNTETILEGYITRKLT